MGCGLSFLEGGGAGSPSMLVTGGNTVADGPESNGVVPHATHVPFANAHELHCFELKPGLRGYTCLCKGPSLLGRLFGGVLSCIVGMVGSNMPNLGPGRYLFSVLVGSSGFSVGGTLPFCVLVFQYKVRQKF